MANAPVRVAIYGRVSTASQHPETQLSELKRYAEAREWTVTAELVDVGISGAKERRPALDQLMALARKRKIDAVLVWRFDRFARSVKHLVSALEEFQALGVDFVSLSESVDTSTPSGKMLFHVMAAVAEFERSLIRERVVAGIARARSAGVRFGRPERPPIDAERARELIGSGRSVNQTAGILGVPRTSLRKALGLMSGRKQTPALVESAA